MKVISSQETKSAILRDHNHFFQTMIKAVVDVRQELIAIDAELHADLENELLAVNKSDQQDLWGVNLFLDKPQADWIEYTALINIRPSMDNRSMEVENPSVREKIHAIVEKLIVE